MNNILSFFLVIEAIILFLKEKKEQYPFIFFRNVFRLPISLIIAKNMRYFKKSTILIYSINMYVIEVNEMNELVCVSVFNPVTFSEAYPDIDHYKVFLSMF